MSECCGGKKPKEIKTTDPCCPPEHECSESKKSVSASGSCESANASSAKATDCPLTWFKDMIPHCLEYVKARKSEGKKIVGIMCEYTPREIIMAAGAIPVCLCGGSQKTISSAEEDLPANLCPLIKSTYGYFKEKSNPFLEMTDLIVAETTCDGKKKMYELMGASKQMHILELPQKPDSPDAMTHWIQEIRSLKSALEERFDVKITDEKLRESISVMNKERSLRRQLAELMKADAPPITGRELLDLKSSISGIPCDFKQYEKAIGMLTGRKPVNDIESRVRVLMTGVPMAHGAERVIEIIEKQGGIVVAQENCTGIKPIIEDVELDGKDPITAIAEKYFHLPCSVMTKNGGRMDLLRRLAKEYRAQCIIELVWQACITYDVESFWVKSLTENELGIPYLRIETDYSPSDSARIAVRVEALFETIKMGYKMQDA